MKMGPFDGTVKEWSDLLENHGLRPEDYLEKPPAQLHTRYLTIPAVLFGASLCAFALFSHQLPPTVTNLFYVLSFGSALWLTVSIQLRFRNGMGTFCTAIGAVLLILLASGALSPRETADFVKELPNK
jgi:hypothetical protein